MNDLISRQAAIDALDVLCQEHRYRIPGKRETYSQYNEAWQDALDRAEGAIRNLPSAQPEERMEERTETHACDCISRQDAINAPIKMVSEGLEWVPVYHLKELPSAEPQIIRCKDCRWWTKHDTTLQGKCKLHNLNPMPEWYCASGEVKS